MEQNKEKQGLMAALFSLIFWGLMPLYWQALRPVDSHIIIFYRIFLVGALCLVLSRVRHGRQGLLDPLKNKRQTLRLILAGVIVTINWSIYIWAVNAELVIQTCLGYYIGPIVMGLFGIIFFKERLDRYKGIAFAFVLVGLVVLLVHFRELPLVALALGVTFATYAALKKTLQMPPVVALFYETFCLMFPALGIILYQEFHGHGATGVAQPHQWVLLLLVGVMTAIPLGLFGYAANRISLTTLGILQYVSPSISLVIGIFVLKEPFDRVQLFSFVLIWVGLAFFTLGSLGKRSLEKFL